MTLWNRCQQAAATLDRERVNWYYKVDLDKLDIQSVNSCIAGQLGLWETPLIHSNPTPYWVGNDQPEVAHMSIYEWQRKLERYWRTLIYTRREKDAKN